MKKILFILILAVSIISQSNAQDSTDTYSEWKFLADIFGFFVDKNISIRNSFEGTKNENKPAFFQLNRNFVNDSLSNNSIDIGFKIGEIGLANIIEVYPVVEWHRRIVNRDLQNKNSENKLSGSLKTEIFGFGRDKSVTILTIKASQDFKDSNVETFTGLEFTLFGVTDDTPNTINKKNSEKILFKFIPYVGGENFTGFSEEFDSFELLKARIYSELNPFRSDILTFITNYTFRSDFGGKMGNLMFYELQANYKITNQFSVSLDYENGRRPEYEFNREHTFKFGIGIKI